MPEVLHGDDHRATFTMPDGRIVRNLTAAEYEATYNPGAAHTIPADVLAAIAPKLEARAARPAAAPPDDLVWMPAYSHGGQLKTILWFVIHSMETDIADGIAEALSGPSWFGGPRAGTSPHQCYDSAGPGVRNLHDDTVAYHAGPTANTYGLGKEHAGRAAFSRAQWTTPAALVMLRASAAETARDCLDHDVPARWLSLVQIAGHEKGLCTHNDIHLVYPQDTTHTDPGSGFPYDLYLQLVQAEIARLTGNNPSEEDDPLSALNDDEQRRLLKNTDDDHSLLSNNIGHAIARIEQRTYALVANQLTAADVAGALTGPLTDSIKSVLADSGAKIDAGAIAAKVVEDLVARVAS